MIMLSSSDIKEKILARESFLVGSENERKVSSMIAKTLGIKYTTRAIDGGDGFNVIHLPKTRRNRK